MEGQSLAFVVAREGTPPHKRIVSRIRVLNYVSMGDAIQWIANDSRGQCLGFDEYEEHLKQCSMRDRTQLFFRSDKLFGCNWKGLRNTSSAFKRETFNEECDIVQVRHHNNDALKININDDSYDSHAIAVVFGSALDRDWGNILEHDLPLKQFDAAAELAESVGIKDKYWCTIQGEEYVRARMRYMSLKELIKLGTVPGSIKSAVLRQSIKNVTDRVQNQVREMVDEGGMHFDESKGSITPSSSILIGWIKEGLTSLTVDDNKQINFDKFKAPVLLKCLELLPATFVIGADVAIQAGAQALLRRLCYSKQNWSISKDIYQVWIKICLLIVKLIRENKVFACGIPVMCVYYHLTIYDGNYQQWAKVFATLMQSEYYGCKWCWKYFVTDVIKADIQNGNFKNLQKKNEYILKGIRQMIRVVGKEQFVLIRDIPNSTSFVVHVMNWLYGVNANDDELVGKEVEFNVSRILNLSARFELVLQVYRYYCFEGAREVPHEVNAIFAKYLSCMFE